MINREDNLALDAMRTQPGDNPQVPAQTIGPGFLTGVSDHFEAGVDVDGTPLVVRNMVLVQV